MDSPRFTVDEQYRRRELHESWGGSYQSGISPSATYPIIFLFTGPTGEHYGYTDGWQPDGTYHYTGEGQVGDMTLTRGNRAIYTHDDKGRRLFLFEMVANLSGYVRFVGEMVYRDHHSIEGVPDRNGAPREVIVFELEPADQDAKPADGDGRR